MTKSTFNIAIKKPCTENWETMTPNEKGRHCFSCQKTVVDFTTMSDSQIIHYFQNYQGKTCGRFLETQVNRPILPPVLPKNQTRWAWLFSVLLLPISAKAQQTTEFSIEQVSKDVKELVELKQKTSLKVNVPMRDWQNEENLSDFDLQTLAMTLTGDVDKVETPPAIQSFKTSEEILQDWMTGFKSLFMSVLSFFKSL